MKNIQSKNMEDTYYEKSYDSQISSCFICISSFRFLSVWMRKQ